MRFLGAGAWQDAEAAAQAALADDPADPSAELLLGLAVAAMGEAGRAAAVLNRVAEVRPDAAHPCTDVAALRPPLPRGLVARQFRACLSLTPDNSRLRLGFAEFLLDNQQPEEAEAVLVDAPDSVAAWHLRGLSQAERSFFGGAIDSFRAAVTMDPNAAASWSNLGMMLKIEGQYGASIEAHDRAVSLAPHNARFRVNRAVALLQSGLWERAWTGYEARLELPECGGLDLSTLLLSLRPSDSLHGTTVLALHEDGYGDTLQFLRYLPMLAARGARVLACVPPALGRLMAMVPGVNEVFTDLRDLPAHDFLCPVFSLPRVFGTTVHTIPPVPKLALDPALLRKWSDKLPIDGLLVGLVWAGQARPNLTGFTTLDRRRSAGLAAFAPLADVPGVRLISLQAGAPARQPRPAGMTLLDMMGQVTDFADTAALIAGLDVVVSVDTSVVHLAGLMGKPVFLLDRYDNCWRWLSDRMDSPWYPHLTIFRQPEPGDWASAVARAAASLHAMAMYRGAVPASAGSGMRETTVPARAREAALID
jgi:tetratricopeptide (TPR) repeat protein